MLHEVRLVDCVVLILVVGSLATKSLDGKSGEALEEWSRAAPKKARSGLESVDDTTVLGEDDLRDVLHAVTRLAGKWENLGISLGIRPSDLDAIHLSTTNSPSDYLTDMLKLWLRQSYNVKKFGKPTWRKLVQAVEDKVGGDNPALAQTIAGENRDKKFRKLESQQQSRLDSPSVQESTDATEIFTLPQNIRVMVSDYQLLQTIFAISESEYHTKKIKTEEQFSPTLSIVDAATRQPLDCVLLLRGEKPPEVSCRALFCYIAVQVSYRDAHGSHPYPLYHVESKPCKQGKLPLVFCFYQPGTVCVIRLSVHSIVDSEGVEYMYHSEDFTCVVQIIDRNQHEGVKLSDQHGVVRMKEPPPLMYTGPLATKKFHKIERQFIKLYLSPNYKDILQLSKLLIDANSVSGDIKVFALCWKALSVAVQSNYKCADEVLKAAWERASQLERENGLLLQGRVLRHLAFMQYVQGHDDKALEYISGAKERLFIAAPSCETAHALYTDLLVRRRKLFSEQNCTFFSQLQECEEEYRLLLEHSKYMEDYEKTAICTFLAMKASFILRSDMITDELPPKEYWPSPDDLRKAEECLNGVPLDTMPSQSNFYTAKYYRAFCDLHIWKRQYPMAMHYLEKAREVRIQLNGIMCKLDQRCKLLERLMGDDKNDEYI